MTESLPSERPVFLSTFTPGRRERRLALSVVLVSLLFFLLAAPFAKVPLGKVFAFIPIYQSALVISDLLTAILLFGQYRILRSKALLVLANGYLFTTFTLIAHLLTFPELFATNGLLGAGPQSTAWLYMFWHGGFPLFVIGYALLKDESPSLDTEPQRGVLRSINGSIILTFLAACGLTLLATVGTDYLMPIMDGNKYTPLMIIVVTMVWLASLVALIVLWQQGSHSVLDLWLMVVLCAWLFDIALSAVLNGGRFDLGFYAGRAYGLLAATFVLVVLMLENSALYARLVEAHKRERQKTADLTAVNEGLEAFSYSVSHDLRAPLRVVDGYAEVLEKDFGDRLDAEGRAILAVVRESAQDMQQLIADLLAFARLGRQPLRSQHVELDVLVKDIIEDLRADYAGRDIDFDVDTLGPAEADPSLLKQALVNLIGNAVKFTRGRKPAKVQIGCQRTEDNAKVYYVSDNGAGFDMNYAHKLFGVFQRLHSKKEFEGTGVGLAIVQRVIDRHGGRIWAESKLGEGSVFFFTLQRSAQD